MSKRWLVPVFVILLVGFEIAAQPPQQQGNPAGQNGDPRVDRLLDRWEKETANLQSMSVTVERTIKDKVFNRQTVAQGTAKFMRPDLAKLELVDRTNPDRWERYVCTGTHIYNFRPQERVVYIHPLPAKRAGQLPDDGALPFLFGMKAQAAKQRYEFTMMKEDEYYYYVKVVPLWPRDQADFTQAMLSILKQTALPRMITWREPPNGNEVTWDIKELHRNAQIGRQEFMKPPIPRGWKPQEQPVLNAANGPAPQPRVIRPQAAR